MPRGAARPPGLPHIPDDAEYSPEQALATAQQLLNDGYAFYAHEVLETAWKAAPDRERDLWQGLAQLAVGLTHVHRGNPRGAQELLRRGAGRIAAYADERPHGVDVPGLLRWADELAKRLDRDPPLAAAPPALTAPAAGGA